MLRQRRIDDRQALFHILSFLVGAIVVISYLSITSGGLNNALTILVFLTICTLGIGLVIISIIAWLVGMIIVGPIWFPVLLYLNRNSARRETSFDRVQQESPLITPNETVPRQERNSLTPNQIAVIEYMRKGSSYGWSNSQITNRLKVQGWSDEDIESAQRIISNSAG
ncbi:hypothetical protein [Argonema antarcticum]|uniref:hypothetical protein n=1 Tax=Argonema antarcticum TaxID=2942763 RepID=UPI002012C26A|nr:hypothetical protein [Argonema antarcticum]MCL1470390.1 hypothetical protein [Argonema antarcticum A004/B2]